VGFLWLVNSAKLTCLRSFKHFTDPEGSLHYSYHIYLRCFHLCIDHPSFLTKFCMHFSSLPCVLYAPPIPSSFDFVTLITFGEEYKLCSSLCSFHRSSVNSSLLRPDIVLSMNFPYSGGPGFNLVQNNSQNYNL